MVLVRCAAALDMLLIRIKMSLSVVIHLSVDHMAVSELVGYSHGSAGMAYATAFTSFPMLRVGMKRCRFC